MQNQICLHLLGVPSISVLSCRDLGIQPSAVSRASQECRLGHLVTQGFLSAGKGGLEGGCFLYSDILNVYLPVPDGFRDGGL